MRPADGAADEDAFAAFRCWLIAQGRELFESALQEADELADLMAGFDPDADGDGEDLGYAADEAYERLTGGELPTSASRPRPASEGTAFDIDDPDSPGALPPAVGRFGADTYSGRTRRLEARTGRAADGGG